MSINNQNKPSQTCPQTNLIKTITQLKLFSDNSRLCPIDIRAWKLANCSTNICYVEWFPGHFGLWIPGSSLPGLTRKSTFFLRPHCLLITLEVSCPASVAPRIKAIRFFSRLHQGRHRMAGLRMFFIEDRVMTQPMCDLWVSTCVWMPVLLGPAGASSTFPTGLWGQLYLAATVCTGGPREGAVSVGHGFCFGRMAA